MTVVVLGIDALDGEFLDQWDLPYLRLSKYKEINTISSSDTGKPSTHELWPTIITGLPPEEHGIQLEQGITWESPILNVGSRLSNYVLPKAVQVKLGAWLLDNTDEDAFRKRSDYYEKNGIDTVFDERQSKAIGIPNYVTDPADEDREHKLRKDMGELFQLDVNDESEHTHTSSDPWLFYEQCMEMAMVRIARSRRALRGGRYELVFGYTSALDLIGHVSYANPSLQQRAYEELNDFVGELREDLDEDDDLLLVSDHGLQDGTHTNEAAVAGTSDTMVENIDSVLDVKDAIQDELQARNHHGEHERRQQSTRIGEGERGEEVREHLEDLGYM